MQKSMAIASAIIAGFAGAAVVTYNFQIVRDQAFSGELQDEQVRRLIEDRERHEQQREDIRQLNLKFKKDRQSLSNVEKAQD